MGASNARNAARERLESELRWAYLAVLSRNLVVSSSGGDIGGVEGTCLVIPGIDMLNHKVSLTYEAERSCPGPRSASRPAPSPRDLQRGHGVVSAHYAPSSQGGTAMRYEVRARKPYRAGEQVFLSYEECDAPTP